MPPDDMFAREPGGLGGAFSRIVSGDRSPTPTALSLPARHHSGEVRAGLRSSSRARPARDQRAGPGNE